MNKEELYNVILNSPIHKYSLLNEIYAIRDRREEKEDYLIGLNGFISLDVLLENYNQVNMIEELKHQLEEKEKVIDKAIEYMKEIEFDKTDKYICIREYKEYQELLEILERGKNGK